MLVLSRKRGERILADVAGTPVWFTVVDIRGDKVRIGIEASQEVKILREEVTDLSRPLPTDEVASDAA